MLGSSKSGGDPLLWTPSGHTVCETTPAWDSCMWTNGLPVSSKLPGKPSNQSNQVW